MFTKQSAAIYAGVLAVAPLQASETANYTYDARGHLTNVQVSGGPASGVQRIYVYDGADNRTQIQVSGPWGNGTVSLSALGSVANANSNGVAIGVNISCATQPTGTVTFTENGLFLGSASASGGEASVILEGFALGTHRITASYSGDSANAPYSFAFTIKVQNLSWLPAVLELLLSN
jgi:hypothetical protein